MHVTDMIIYWARTDPHRPALVQPEIVTSYQALANAIESIGQRIDRFGLDRNVTVGVSLASPAFLTATVLALLHRGYSAALIHRRLIVLMRGAGIRDLIYDSQGQVLSGGRNIRFDESWLPRPGGPGLEHGRSSDQGGNLVYFTSGTTGLPKKVVQTAQATQVMLQYPYTCASLPGSKVLVMPGVTTTFGFNRVCEILNVGKTACFAPDSASALALISLFEIETVVASAAQALGLVQRRRANAGFNVGTVSTIFVGGGQMSPESIASIRAALCKTVVNQYGSTEAGVVALTPFDVLQDAPGGVPLPWVDLQIVDEAGRVLPTGSEGLVRCRTPQLAANLTGTDTPPNVKDEWFYPGDIGSMTTDGILRIVGRSSDVINRGGVKVSGDRIEKVLGALPGVKEAAACGIVGDSGLEEIWVAIVPDGAVDIDDIKAGLRSHDDIGIAPDEVFIVDELPRGELGKVQKYRLKELLLGRKRAS